MDEERSKLEYELSFIDKRLEKEKTKRILIMILIYSVLCGLIIFKDNDGIFDLIFSSIILGGISTFVTSIVFVLVSDVFTNTTYLEYRKKRLEEKLKINDDEY